jgi:hypothetical protein
MVGRVELRTHLLDLVRPDHARVDAEQPVRLGALHHRVQRAVGVREREVAVLREQHVEVEVLGERLVQVHARLVEAGALRRQIVRADDGRVAARRAGADVRLLEHGDVLQAEPGRQVVGGRHAVRAAADDDDVVVLLQLVRAEEAVLADETEH